MEPTRHHVVPTRVVLLCATPVLAVLIATLTCGIAGAAGKKKSGKEIAYVSLGEATKRAREDYRPFVVYFDGGAGYESMPDDVPMRWEEATRSMSRRLSRLVTVCRVSEDDLGIVYPLKPSAKKKADAPEKAAEREKKGARVEDQKKKPSEKVAERLGLVASVPTVLVVDFRERVVRRYVTEFPKKTAFQRSLREFVRRNAKLANYARAAEKVLERAKYSYELGKRRTAVQQVLPFEDPREKKKMDPVLKGEVEKVLTRYRGDAQKLVKKGFTLDKKKKYAAALKVLEDVAHQFPFPDLLKKVHVKRAEILRKAQLGI